MSEPGAVKKARLESPKVEVQLDDTQAPIPSTSNRAATPPALSPPVSSSSFRIDPSLKGEDPWVSTHDYGF